MSNLFHVITVTTYEADDTELKNPKAEVQGKIESTSIEDIQGAKQWLAESLIGNKMQAIFKKEGEAR